MSAAAAARSLAALVLAVLCGSLSALGADPAPRFSAPGDFDLTLQVGSKSRTFLVHLPPRFAERGPLPVLLAFHGGGGSAQGFQKYAGLDAVADREGFAVVYPDGSGRLGRRLLSWNAGGCCGRAREDRVDDVGFAIRLLGDLARDLPLDRTRVYATGHSNGAMMAYRFAAEAKGVTNVPIPVWGLKSFTASWELALDQLPLKSDLVYHVEGGPARERGLDRVMVDARPRERKGGTQAAQVERARVVHAVDVQHRHGLCRRQRRDLHRAGHRRDRGDPVRRLGAQPVGHHGAVRVSGGVDPGPVQG